MWFLFKKIQYGFEPKSTEFHQQVRSFLKGIKKMGLENYFIYLGHLNPIMSCQT